MADVPARALAPYGRVMASRPLPPDPHDPDEVKPPRRLGIAWFLWPLGVLLLVMLVAWLL